MHIKKMTMAAGIIHIEPIISNGNDHIQQNIIQAITKTCTAFIQ